MAIIIIIMVVEEDGMNSKCFGFVCIGCILGSKCHTFNLYIPSKRKRPRLILADICNQVFLAKIQWVLRIVAGS